MAQFDYTARGADGQRVTGSIEAVDASAAAKVLISRNVTAS